LRLRSGCAALAVALLAVFMTPPAALAASTPDDSSGAEATSTSGSTTTSGNTASKTKKKKKKKKTGKKKRTRKKKTRAGAKAKKKFGVTTVTSAEFGVIHGRGVRKLSAPLLEVRARIEPFARFGKLELTAPASFIQRTPLGVSLQETRGFARIGAEYAPLTLLRFDGSLGGVLVVRPNWPDLYQVEPDGTLVSTDRFSYFERVVTLGAAFGRVALRARAEYAYSLADYRNDPHFEPIERPNHIPPGDREEHQVRVSLRGGPRSLKAGAALLVEQRSFFYVFARDAGTGKTHAGPGGPPPNPLLKTVELAPTVDLRWSPADEFTVHPAFTYSFVNDTFEGYFSYSAPRPSLDVDFRPTPRFGVELKLEYEYRRYGPDSYAPGPDHPPLDFGTRRIDDRLETTIGASYRVAPGWELVLDARGVRRRTNFPSYVPYVYPSTQPYDIDWDYDNATLLFGARFSSK
jgi:hypothetical protein